MKHTIFIIVLLLKIRYRIHTSFDKFDKFCFILKFFCIYYRPNFRLEVEIYFGIFPTIELFLGTTEHRKNPAHPQTF
jgi:hypothetical protein